MTIYKTQSIWDELEEIQFLVTEQKKYIHCFTSAVVLCKRGCSVTLEDCVSELKADAMQGSACSQLIGIKHFSCPTCTTAMVIHQCEAKLALENILII